MNETKAVATLVSLQLLQPNTGQIEGVPANPRLIKNAEFENLKRSILVFPQMLELRPLVYAGDYVVLGGNQRRGALLDISEMSFKKLAAKLEKYSEFTGKTKEEQDGILTYWEQWLNNADKPVPTYNASHLSTEQLCEFVIKDNVQFGENDWDILASEWDTERIQNWGLSLPNEWDGEESEESEKDPFADEGIVAQNQFGVIIMCANESEQERIFNKMQEDGYVCKIVVT